MPDPLALSYLRALIPKRTSRATLKELVRAERTGMVIDPVALARYRALCGFTRSSTVPATYPHLAAFPIAMRLMTARTFPIPVLGLVHTANRITRARPLEAGMTLNHAVWIEAPTEHAKGIAFEVHAEARDAVDGEVVWRSASTYLHLSPGRSRGTAGRSGEAGSASASVGEPWRLPADLGRQYAAISGDRNPIHLHAVTARAFGFPQPIAHGMWSAARSLAAIEERFGVLPERFQYDIEFNAPVPLPSTVRFRSWEPAAGEYEFELWDEAGDRRRLRGALHSSS